VALVAADMIAVTSSKLIVAAASGARFTIWAVALLPLFALLAKAGGLYDRDQFVLHKTTLDEAPALLAVAALFTLVIEGVRALEFTGHSYPLLLWGLLSATLLVARAVARFLTVRATAGERVLVIGDAAALGLIKRKFSEDRRSMRWWWGESPPRTRLPRASTGRWAPSTSWPTCSRPSASSE
jgi:FlaA1/EpsC-like NDP-sugar epimerase